MVFQVRQPIDLGDELRQRVHFRFDLAPVILCRPIARERLDRRKLYSLGCICHGFPFRPFCRIDAPAQFGDFGFRNIYMKRMNCSFVISLPVSLWCNSGLSHDVLLHFVVLGCLVCTVGRAALSIWVMGTSPEKLAVARIDAVVQVPSRGAWGSFLGGDRYFNSAQVARNRHEAMAMMAIA